MPLHKDVATNPKAGIDCYVKKLCLGVILCSEFKISTTNEEYGTHFKSKVHFTGNKNLQIQIQIHTFLSDFCGTIFKNSLNRSDLDQFINKNYRLLYFMYLNYLYIHMLTLLKDF
jgi:hypothetical protein